MNEELTEDWIRMTLEKKLKIDGYVQRFINAVLPGSYDVHALFGMKLLGCIAAVSAGNYVEGFGRETINVLIEGPSGTMKTSTAEAFQEILGKEKVCIINNMERFLGLPEETLKKAFNSIIILDDIKPKDAEFLMRCVEDGKTDQNLTLKVMPVSASVIYIKPNGAKYDEVFLSKFDAAFSVPEAVPKDNLQMLANMTTIDVEKKIALDCNFKDFALNKKTQRIRILKVYLTEAMKYYKQCRISKEVEKLLMEMTIAENLSLREIKANRKVIRALAALRFSKCAEKRDLKYFKKWLKRAYPLGETHKESDGVDIEELFEFLLGAVEGIAGNLMRVQKDLGDMKRIVQNLGELRIWFTKKRNSK